MEARQTRSGGKDIKTEKVKDTKKRAAAPRKAKQESDSDIDSDDDEDNALQLESE